MSKIRDFIESADWAQITGYALVAVCGIVIGYSMKEKEPETNDVAYISLTGDPDLLKKALDAMRNDTK